jgi:cytochrome P450
MPDSENTPVTIFTDPNAYADLQAWHSVAARLRKADPVCRIEVPRFEPFWAVTRHADVIEIERQNDKFHNTIASVLQTSDLTAKMRELGPMLKTLINMDGQEHRNYRAVTNDWFKPNNLRRTFETRIAELSRKYVDRMVELGGECDFAMDVARFYPLQVIMSILGVPESDELKMLDLTQKLFGADDPDFAGGPDRQAAALAAVMDFISYFRDMTADRRAHPSGDLASTIANGAIDGQPLDDLRTFSYYVIVATAGHDTTSSTLAGGLEELIRNPDQIKLLQQNPDLIDNAVEEMTRWVTPVRHFMRFAQEDYILRGTKIKAGDGLLMSYLSANRDEEVFEQPFRFDVQRKNAEDHLAFGVGVHFCLGATLARMELRTFFRELLPRLEQIELTGPTQYTAATFVGAPKRIPIRYKLRK